MPGGAEGGAAVPPPPPPPGGTGAVMDEELEAMLVAPKFGSREVA